MASGTCGDNLTWTLDDDGTLTISGTGEMYNYLFPHEAPWYSSRKLIRKVVLEVSVTTIGDRAFRACKSLTSVIIPDSVTMIGAYAFNCCTGLTSVIIPNSVTTIGSLSFRYCKSLTSVIIPDSVTTIGAGAFSQCNSLTNVIIPDSVTTIGREAFNWCTGLTNVTIPDSVTTIGGWAFNWCISLKEIHYPSRRGFEKVLSQGNNTKLIPYDNLPPAQIEPPAQSAPPAQAAPPDKKIWKLVDETIAEIRRAAELAAMNIVMTIERDLGFSPEDVSSQNLGYDIKSTSRDGKTLRLIEVKGRHIDAETVTVSRNEIDAALNNPDDFILAIVRLDGGKNETIYIRKPFKQPPDRAALSVNFSIQKLVEVSEIVPG